MYGHTDLADFYRDRLTLRQVWVRILALPRTCMTWALIEDEERRANERGQVNEVEQTLAPFRK